MSSKTKIVVLHMKEVIYTGIFLLLLVILGVVMFLMFGSGKSKTGIFRCRFKIYARNLPYFYPLEQQHVRCRSNGRPGSDTIHSSCQLKRKHFCHVSTG